MPPPRPLKGFLATARSALTAPPSKRAIPLTFVVGNESADLDSLCSAILLAYFRSYTPPHTLHIPLCQLVRDDLSLRPEFGAVLRHAALTPDDVLTLDELPDRLSREDTRWILVDHNAMTGELGRTYSDRVAGCIDHHADEGKVPHNEEAELRVIEKSGSCTSLVVEQCRETWHALSSAHGKDDAHTLRGEIDGHLAHLALGPILIDTTNLTDRNKTTAHDETAVSIAESKITNVPIQFDRSVFYARISALKQDITPMSMRDILRKDYKEWRGRTDTNTGTIRSDPKSLKLGTSSIPQSFAFLVDKKAGGNPDTFCEELERWSDEKGIDLLVILTAFTEKATEDEEGKGAFRRELLAWARTDAAVEAAKEFERKNSEHLQLGTWEEGRLDDESGKQTWRRCWVQGRVESSRKQIAPLFRDLLE